MVILARTPLRPVSDYCPEIIVAQCNSWLALFTKGAVLAAKNDPQQITVKPTTAALSWIAAPQLAKY